MAMTRTTTNSKNNTMARPHQRQRRTSADKHHRKNSSRKATCDKKEKKPGFFGNLKRAIMNLCCPMYSTNARYNKNAGGNNSDQYIKRKDGAQYCDVNVQREECSYRNGKLVEDEGNFVSECFIDCCCPLYAVRRDFDRALAYTPASNMQVESIPEPTAPPPRYSRTDPMNNDDTNKSSGPGNDVRRKQNNQGCLYFDNFGLEDCS